MDYEKLPPKGYQLFIKVYLNADSVFFMDISPERWVNMEETGNIVVNIQYTLTGDGKRIITGATEIEN